MIVPGEFHWGSPFLYEPIRRKIFLGGNIKISAKSCFPEIYVESIMGAADLRQIEWSTTWLNPFRLHFRWHLA